MIERKFVKQKLNNFEIKEVIREELRGTGHSATKIEKTPLGEKITIYSSKPGLVVGRGGKNIKSLTRKLKSEFDLENPQLEVSEVVNPYLDAKVVSEQIASNFERFGAGRFKGVVHKLMGRVMNSGALGISIRISGKVPSARSRSWLFSKGYMKKSGNFAKENVSSSISIARLRPGLAGIKVSILPDVKLPDRVDVKKVEVESDKTDNEDKSDKKDEKSDSKGEKKSKKSKSSSKKSSKKDKSSSKKKKSKSKKSDKKSKKKKSKSSKKKKSDDKKEKSKKSK